MTYEEIFPAIESKSIDFILSNSGVIACMQSEFDVAPIATLVAVNQIGQMSQTFAGTIFSKSTSGITQVGNLSTTLYYLTTTHRMISTYEFSPIPYLTYPQKTLWSKLPFSKSCSSLSQPPSFLFVMFIVWLVTNIISKKACQTVLFWMTLAQQQAYLRPWTIYMCIRPKPPPPPLSKTGAFRLLFWGLR